MYGYLKQLADISFAAALVSAVYKIGGKNKKNEQ